jgi:CHAT domain-containing protein/tetratricopeptide (TPR) repeat protein
MLAAPPRAHTPPQARLPSDSLQQLVERGDSRVVAIVQQFPDTARSTFARLLSLAATTPAPAARASHLTTAHRLAAAYAVAWNDSFFVRQASRFTAWTPAQRLTKAAVDSLRIAGGVLLGKSGPADAMRAWRESYRLAQAIGDSAGQGSSLGNIAVAFYRQDALDSAEVYLNRSRALAERIGDVRTRLNAMGTLATVAKDRRDFARARTLYTQTLALRERTGDDRGAASDENNLGLVAEAFGDTAAARRGYEAALARNLRTGRTSIASDNITNLANLATLRGDYEDASAKYHEALAIRRAAGERAREAPVLHNLGLLELRRGAFVAARDALAAAIEIFDVSDAAVDAIIARTDLAQAQGAMGDLQSALNTMRRADSIAKHDSLPDMLASVALARADLAVEFNALADAERSYTAASNAFAALGDKESQADALQGLGLLRLRRDDAGGARATFEEVLRTRSTSRDRQAIALTQLLLGYALTELNDRSAARRQVQSALASLRGVGDAVGEAMALGALADLELRAADYPGARQLYDQALSRLGNRIAPSVTAELRSGRARALAAQGAWDAAATELRAAIDATETLAGNIRLAERRAGYRADKWSLYERLALIERRRGRDTAAFAISERLRGREMLELLAEGRVPVAANARGSLVAREQDLRHRVATLERALENEHGRDQVRGLTFRADVTGASRAALDAAQRAYADVLDRLHEEAADYGQLVQPVTADAHAVAARLRPDEALLEYLVSDSTTLVFVVRHGEMRAIDLGITRRSLAAAIDFTRDAISGGATGATQQLWRAPLQRLHRVLIDPVERSGALRGVRTLLIAPHAELHYLPFAALIGAPPAQQFLVEQYDIAYVPSASVWMRLIDRTSSARAAGVLAFAPRPDALPGSRDEVGALRSLYGSNATVLAAGAATEAAFRARAPSAAIIHFATYGVLNKHNPLFSFVELTRDGRDDGHLAVHEVFGAELHAQLVVLSACQTALASGAAADVPAGDDWIGLVRAFLFAGADNVLATLWPVQDRSSAVVMRGFYEELPGRSLPAALALAQRRAIRDKRTAGPLHWAAYSLVGATRTVNAGRRP